MSKAAALVRTWLLIDFFGDARRAGRGHGSSLTTTIFAQSFFALVFATLLYPDVPPVPFAAANLCLSSLLVAIGALGDEGRPNRRAADDVLVGTAPLPRFAIVLARGGHAAFYVLLVTIGMALPPGILLAQLTHDWRQVGGYVLAACACSGLATGALGIVGRAATRALGTARAALLQGTLKAALLGGGLVLFALGLRRLQGTADALPIGRLGAELLPPYHAAKLLAAPTADAWRLLPFAGGALLLLLLAMALAIGGQPTRSTIRRGRLAPALLRRLCGGGARLGVAEFVAVTMWRSAGFRARVLPLLGMPIGMVALTLGGERQDGFVLTSLLLQLPAIYLPFLIAFLPRADQPGTGWVFAQAPGLTLPMVQDATWRALVTHVLMPVHALALLLLLLLAPNRVDTAAAAVFAFGVAVLAARVMVRTLLQVPFTATSESDASADLGGAFAAALVLGGLGTGFALSLTTPVRWATAIAVLAVAWHQLRPRSASVAGDDAAVPTAAAMEPAAGVDQGRAKVPETDAERVDPATSEPRAEATLRRELRAILVLYAATSVLPWLIGTTFAP